MLISHVTFLWRMSPDTNHLQLVGCARHHNTCFTAHPRWEESQRATATFIHRTRLHAHFLSFMFLWGTRKGGLIFRCWSHGISQPTVVTSVREKTVPRLSESMESKMCHKRQSTSHLPNPLLPIFVLHLGRPLSVHWPFHKAFDV